MSFTIEFQPVGIRLVSEEPLTLLDAARRAGVSLRSDCGGAGICGKCTVQIFSQTEVNPPTDLEKSLFTENQLNSGMRLACEAVASGNLKVQIPSSSVIKNQVLQVEGRRKPHQPDQLVFQQEIKLEKPSLNDLASDFSRLQKALANHDITAGLHVIRQLPTLLRKNDWQANLLIHNKTVMNLTPKPLSRLLGLAVDVGSTKLAAYLVDLETGELLAALGVPNPQIAYGEDIMARLSFGLQNQANSSLLHQLLMKSIQQAAIELCDQIGVSPATIVDACLVGNTAMHHFFLNLPVESLAFSPFAPVLSGALSPLASEIGLDFMPGSFVYTPAVVAGFIGSDHLAFLLAEGFGKAGGVQLGIDIGTNTEIALQKGGRVVSVSTASGPAFEGAHIRFGMRAAPGAIEHITIEKNGDAKIQVIGNQEPVGICGSGILDVVSEMRRMGWLNHRGRMEKSARGMTLDNEGKPSFILANAEKKITISQHDIDQILLAKGAIRAGIDVLMDYLQVSKDEIDKVLIAGAFGSFMLPEHAIRIGMLPEIPLSRIQTVGNAAGTGARMMLISKSNRQRAENLAKQIEYLELTVYPEFPLFYARGIQA